MINRERLRNPGGTGGGLGMFIFGLVLAAGGGYLLLDRVQVTSASWRLWGVSGFGLTLVPLLLGVFLLFINGRSIIGWLLTIAGAAFIFFGILTNMDIYFARTSLFETLLMLIMFVGGLGLIARSLRGAPDA